jgi:hypothetical protein
MKQMKKSNKYYFSVEGETEQWYLSWLQEMINDSADAKYKVSFKISVEKNPIKYAKTLSITGKTEVFHICDYESDEECHEKNFKETMDNMKNAGNIGKQIKYKFGYTNLTFELWMILHKEDCNAQLSHRKQYLEFINKAYSKKFRNMNEYKTEKNFKGLLSNLTIFNVIDAIKRADSIMHMNEKNGYTEHEYKGYKYYKENPSMTVYDIIKTILMDCELMKIK